LVIRTKFALGLLHTSSEHPDIVLTRAKLLRTSKNTQRCD